MNNCEELVDLAVLYLKVSEKEPINSLYLHKYLNFKKAIDIQNLK